MPAMLKRAADSAIYALRRIPMKIRNPTLDEEDAMLFKADPELMKRAHEIIRILSADPDDVEEEEEHLDDFGDVHARVIALRRRLGLPIINNEE
ncbi:hypothetical protein PENSPDRAFT_688037 [Peniophora sp. CONT]|nr:hypothetical protein PENSPDRAFT_688037 [Peniophora sp. CONT]